MKLTEKRKNRNSELELAFLTLDNLREGIAICDEDFKPLIHNTPMLYYTEKFMDNTMKKNRKKAGNPERDS